MEAQLSVSVDPGAIHGVGPIFLLDDECREAVTTGNGRNMILFCELLSRWSSDDCSVVGFMIILGLFIAQGSRFSQSPDVDAVIKAFRGLPEFVNWKGGILEGVWGYGIVRITFEVTGVLSQDMSFLRTGRIAKNLLQKTDFAHFEDCGVVTQCHLMASMEIDQEWWGDWFAMVK